MLRISSRARANSLIALCCAVAASLPGSAGVWLATVSSSHPLLAKASGNESHSRHLAARRAHLRAKARQAVIPDVTYPAEGIDVSAAAPFSPGPLASTASSPAAVLSSFESQPVPQAVLGAALSAQIPAIDLRTVKELHPLSAAVKAGVPFTAWVVTYANTSSPVLGPSNVTSVSGCTSVAVMVASTGAWSDFFQECGSSK